MNTSSINAEIIAVGTELLLGQIANTNAQWLSDQLAQNGINVLYHSVIGDNLNRVQETFSHAQSRSDLVIVTGGLGPTEDDMTREAFSALSGLSMINHELSLKKIVDYYERHQLEMTPNNEKQARVFEGAIVLENMAGMAPGMIVEHADCTWIFLPGIPREMKQLFGEGVLSHIKKLVGTDMVIKSTVLKFAGIGESQLEHELKDLIANQHNPTIAPLSQSEGNVIRLTAKERSDEHADVLLEATKSVIVKRLHNYYVGSDEDTLESVVVSQLKALHWTVGAAESLTGGLFTAKLISVPGASDVCPGGLITYHNDAKQQLLGVSKDILDNYGAVSEQCALEMARQVKTTLQTKVGISFTGVAGPDQVEEQPVGSVYIALSADNGFEKVHHIELEGNRNTIRQKAVMKGLTLLFNFINSQSTKV
ncbi:competence/damage-inducible protein A [Lentibacillus saliphilus]|uniref:competence/damage-inducible protein A n=1 Tax=Lentibacillus saliphilus TaxID=2737028 RepID=UPI001C2FC0A7|nr:competence/damage-inducible protein A [Lentibacillus saliphilus]